MSVSPFSCLDSDNSSQLYIRPGCLLLYVSFSNLFSACMCWF